MSLAFQVRLCSLNIVIPHGDSASPAEMFDSRGRRALATFIASRSTTVFNIRFAAMNCETSSLPGGMYTLSPLRAATVMRSTALFHNRFARP